MPKWLAGSFVTLLFLLGVFAFGYGQGRNSERRESAKALAAQKLAMEKECGRVQGITTDVDKSLQKDLADINGRLTSSLLLHPACMPVAGRAASADASGRSQHAGSNGIRADWLRRYAAEAETYRVKLKACQTFLIKERE